MRALLGPTPRAPSAGGCAWAIALAGLVIIACRGSAVPHESQPPRATGEIATTARDASDRVDLGNRLLDEEGRLARAIPALAAQLIAGYQDSDRKVYLEQLFPLQLAAGRYAEARQTIAVLRQLQITDDPARFSTANMQFEIYAFHRRAPIRSRC